MQEKRGSATAKIGVAMVVVIIAGLLVLPPMILNAVGFNQTEIIMQLNNSHALVNGDLTQMATDGKTVPHVESGQTMVPLRWMAEKMGLTIAWDAKTKAITLTDGKKKDARKAAVRVGQKQMTVDGKSMALKAPAVQENGVTYVPARAVADAFGWNTAFASDEKGALICLDNRKKAAQLSQKKIDKALGLLGPSHAQMLAHGMVARAGSDYVFTGKGYVQLQDEGGSVALIQRKDDSDAWVPLKSLTSLLGTQVKESGGSYQALLSSGNTVNLGSASDTGTVRLENNVAYVNVQKLGSVLGLHVTTLDHQVVALTTMSLKGFQDQQNYLQEMGQKLPVRAAVSGKAVYVALTFDDGPTGGKNGMTVHLLNGLKQRGVHATFFMCGYRIEDYHTHMARYLAEGHEVGNHTYHHKGLMMNKPASYVYQEFASNNALIKSYCGVAPVVGRPVGGGYNAMVLAQMKKAGLAAITWSVDTLDWKYRDANRIRNVIVNNAKDGDIVLMHDLHPATLQGVLAAIDILQQRGYHFVTVSELASIKGVMLEPGKVYTSFH